MADYNSLYTGAQIDAGVGKANTAVQPAQIANFETTTQLNTRDTNNRDRANHTGTQASSTISDFNSAVTAVVNSLGLSAALDSAAIILLIDSDYVQARQSLVGGGGGLDSALTIQLIDSNYVQARQDFAYASLTGKPLILDSDLITQLIDSDYVALRAPASGLDSALATQLIDSAYVQARQDFAYSSLTGTPTVLDSALTIQLIDSNYVQARQDFAYASLTGTPTLLDSALITQLIDSAYVALRAPAASGGLDSALTTQLIDSAYVQARQDFAYSSLTGAPTALSAFINDTLFLDSATATQLIDSAYIQARQSTVGTGGLDSALVTQLIDSAYVQLRETPQDFAYASLTGTPNVLDSADVALIAGSISGLDSNGVRSLVDSAYVQLRQLTYDFLDSAEAIALIDSAHVQARQDYAYSSLTGTPTTFDSNSNAVFATLTTTGNVIVGGDLQVSGTTTTVDAENLSITDNMIYLNAGESAGSPTLTVDLGFAFNYNDDGSYAHGGFFRDATDNVFKIFQGYTPEPDAAVEINTGHASFALADFQAAEITGTTLTGVYQGFDSDFTAKSTTDLSEGTNLYYTKSRVDSDILALVDSAYVQLRQSTVGTGGLDSAGVRTLLADSSFTIDGDGTNGGVIISDGSVEIKTSTGSPAFADFYCEVGNIHRTRVKSAPHAQYSGNVDVTLPVTTGTLALTSDITLDSAAVISLIDSAYVQLRQSSVGSGGLDSALVTQLIDSAYVALRAPAAAGGIDSAAANSLIDAKIEIIDIADIIGATGNTGEYLKSLGNGNAEWATFESVIDSAYIQLRQSSVGSGGLDSALVTQLIDSAYIQLRQTDLTGLDSALTIQLIDSAYVQLRQDFAYSSLTGAPNVLDSADVSAIAGGLSGLDSNGVIALVDSAYVQLRQDFAYASLTGAPTALSSFTNDTLYLDSATATQLIDSAYVALRAPAAAGGIDSAAANTLIDAKVQVLNIADIVGANGNPGEYLKSLGSGNATWENVTTVIDSAYVAARAPAAAIDSAGVISLVDSAYVAARVTGTLSAWQKKSENYTLAVGDRIAVNTDSAWTLTLPASPSFSDEVYIIDATGNAALKNITVSGNSQKILASDSDLIINVNRASVAMMFYGDSQGWILTSAF